MAWITSDDLEAAYDVVVTPAFITHMQGLAEVCTGPVVGDPPATLRAVFLELVYRRSLAGDDNVASETLGPWQQTRASHAGQGITDRECRLLKRAAGRRTVGAVGVGSGGLETPPRDDTRTRVEDTW